MRQIIEVKYYTGVLTTRLGSRTFVLNLKVNRLTFKSIGPVVIPWCCVLVYFVLFFAFLKKIKNLY